MYKLIIVEDDIHTIAGIKKLISQTDFNIELVAVAHNGREGIEIIKKYNPDIIFSDIHMPFMNGFEMLESIKDFNTAPQIIMLTGFDDFTHAKLAIDANVLSYIVKPASPDEVADALKKATEACDKQRALQAKADHIEKNISVLQQQIVENLFFHSSHSEEEIDYFEQEYSIFLKNMKYCCISLDTNSQTEKLDEIIIRLNEKYNTYCSGLLRNHANILITFDSCIPDYTVYTEITELCREFSDTVFIAVGNIVKTLPEIPDSFKNSNEIIKYTFCYGFHGIISYNDFVCDMQNFITKPPSINKQALLNAISLSNIQMLYDVFYDLKAQFAALMVYDPKYMKSLFFDICNMIISSGTYSKNTEESNDLWSDIENCLSPEDVFLYCENLLLDYKKANTSKNCHAEQEIVKQMIKFIEDNYDKNVTLTSIAHQLYCSRNYLSIIFQKHVGIEFRLYLQNYRMEKAASLLRSSNYKLFEIASMVGYKDLKTFRQTFVKHYGVLPSEYQNSDE